MPSVVLISGAGGAGTIEIIRTLKEMGCYRIVAIDASPYAYGLKLADAGYVVPFATAPDFKGAIESIMVKEKPDYVIPLVDEEILAFHTIAEQFSTTVITPVPHFCRLSLDKWLTCQTLREAGILVPETWLATDKDAIKYPAIIKPRSGRGSRGLACLRRVGDLNVYLERVPDPPQAYVVQKNIDGREFTVSAVVGLDGQILAIVPKEVLIKSGITLAGVTRIVPEIETVCRQIQERLTANGPFNVQLIIDEQNKPHIFEINPRYSTTVALTIAAGVHEVDLVIRHAQGEKFNSPTIFAPDLMMIRHFAHEYMPESNWAFKYTSER